jgi:hypothetical protein
LDGPLNERAKVVEVGVEDSDVEGRKAAGGCVTSPENQPQNNKLRSPWKGNDT